MTETSKKSTSPGTSPGTGPGTARPSVAIIGAGVCGLGIGWRLAQAGCRVDVFDKGEAGRGATWAAAGMLAGGVETEPGEEALLPLAQFSQQMWPAFARELRAASGIDVEYRDEGTLVVALTRDDLEGLKQWQDVFGDGFKAMIIFAYHLLGPENKQPTPHVHTFRGEYYAFLTIQVDTYAALLAGDETAD